MRIQYVKKKKSDKTYDVIVDGKKIGVSTKPGLSLEALGKMIKGTTKKPALKG